MDTMEWEELQIKETGARKEFDTMTSIISRKDRVAEGVLECKCGSKRVESTQVQSRSRDKGMSIVAKCSICGKKWKE